MGSWAVISEGKRIYFSGDGGYDIHFKEIGNKLGPFDFVFMENGQYSPYWKLSHVLPIQAFADLKGKASGSYSLKRVFRHLPI